MKCDPPFPAALRVLRVAAAAALLLVVQPDNAVAQNPGTAPSIQALWPAEDFLAGRAPLEFELSRPLTLPEERLAIVVGDIDVSALVQLQGTRATFRPTAMRLPSGQSDVAAYIVDEAGQWTGIGRFPLNVRTRLGLDEGDLVPSADLSSTGQLDQHVPDPTNPPDRVTYQDLTLRLGVESMLARDGWELTARGNAIGVTREEQRLRWSQIQADAPPIDLSDYHVRLTRGRARLSLGSISAGANRYLLSGFRSRGIGGGVRIGDVGTLDAAVMNGTNVVGWGNPLGLAEPSHRMSSLTLGLELVPSRPGALHVDITGFNGSVLPLTSFNQGAATDAEASNGFGVQVSVSDATQRLRFAGGLSRSRFDNPADPALAGGASLVEVEQTTRTARYGELSVEMLRGWTITPSIPVSLATTVRHERVDPLYRSVGAYVQSDIEKNDAALTGAVGPLSFQTSLSHSRDNLAGIESILTTRTRTRSMNGAVPIGALFGVGYGGWYLPSLSASWQRVHQYGEGVPVDGGFSGSHVPDQMSTNQSLRLDWMHGRWNVAWSWNRSHQDNRQEGREDADFRTTVHAVSVGVTPATWLRGSLDLSSERQHNLEFDNTQELERFGGSLQLQPTRSTTLSGSLSRSRGLDPFAGQHTRNTEFNMELAQGFTVYGRQDAGTQGRVFVRYARTRAVVRPFEPVSLVDPFMTWTLNAGASFRIY